MAPPTPKGKFHILIDLGHGSSGKGAVAPRLAELLHIGISSSNHGPNAGHFVEREDGQRFLLKVLPSAVATSWLTAEPNHQPHPMYAIMVGPNSAFERAQLARELHQFGGLMHPPAMVLIHARAAVTEQHHKDAEGPGGALSTLHISSTMSGAGATYAMKAMRLPPERSLLAGDPGAMELELYCDTRPPLVADARQFWGFTRDALWTHDILHEVAQGFALSLDYGTEPRHCTYRNVTAQQAAADMGILPTRVGHVFGNLRTFPIRVGNNYDAHGQQVGYSGGWESDQIELDWDTIGRNAGMPEDEIARLRDKELTSVTKKLRRVASFTNEGTRFACAFNGVTHLILNFVQYIDWSVNGARGGSTEWAQFPGKVRNFVHSIEDETNLPVVMLGTGPKHRDFVLPYDQVDYVLAR